MHRSSHFVVVPRWQATASTDNETDAFIQKMIREKFSDITVFTIGKGRRCAA